MPEDNNYRIFLSPPHQSGDELDYLSKALESNWLAPGGEFVREFEGKLKKITNYGHCVALNSGTAAIHLALKTLEVERGGYVICQTFSFVATANPIDYLGAIPVFIDSEVDTWNMDPDLLEEAILDLHKQGIVPKAIIYAHIYGNPAKVSKLTEVSNKYRIPLIEDAAEALGTSIHSNSVSNHGKISILSFNGNKVITTSGGGALLTDNKEIAQRTLHLATQARDEMKPYSHTEIGYNYRMSNLCASLGLAQITRLSEWVEKKRDIFDRYKTIGKKYSISWAGDSSEGISNRWLSTFLFSSTQQRDKIQKALKIHGIESRRLWKPLHTQNIFHNKKSYISGVANELFKKGICLPSGVGLTEDEQAEIIKIITTKE